MTRFIALYPRAWRDRYETEFLAILEEQPGGSLDHFDIVRGALDARLHPELAGGWQVRQPRSVAALLTGGLAASAGLGWLAWIGLILRDFRGWGNGTPASADLMVLLSVAGALAATSAVLAIAISAGDTILPIGRLGAILAALGFFLTAFGAGMSMAIALVGVVVLAWSMAGLAIPRWLAIGWIGMAALALAAMLAFVAGGGKDVGLLGLAVPYGVAWLLVGVSIAIRGPRSTTPMPATPD
jgi:hypothetical protein